MIQNGKSKITDDDIKAQWRKQKEAHQSIKDSVVQIGKALGLTVDSEGNLTGEADTSLVKSVQPSTSVQPEASSTDSEQQKLKELHYCPLKILTGRKLNKFGSLEP